SLRLTRLPGLGFAQGKPSKLMRRSRKIYGGFIPGDETLDTFLLSVGAAHERRAQVVKPRSGQEGIMSWELLEFKLEEVSGPVQVFNFEAVLKEEMAMAAGIADGAQQAAEPLFFRGDGLYMTRTKQLRLNRQNELAKSIGG